MEDQEKGKPASELRGTEPPDPERQDLVQVKIPSGLLAELERITTLNRQSRHSTIAKLLSYALESVDPVSGKLPDVHPETGRSIEQITSHPRQLRNEAKNLSKK